MMEINTIKLKSNQKISNSYSFNTLLFHKMKNSKYGPD